MGMTMTQKILAAHSDLTSVSDGRKVSAKVDLVLGNGRTTPLAIDEFERMEYNKVFDSERIVVILDHFSLNKDIKTADQIRQCRDFAKRYRLSHFFDVGRSGLEQAILPEQGIVTAGDCVIGADKNTCTYGAVGAFSIRTDSEALAHAMAYGTTRLTVPAAINVRLLNSLPLECSGKDLILTILGLLGTEKARGKSLEFTGEGVASLSMDDRLCICNMVVEAGAANGIFPVDGITLHYLNGRSERTPVVYIADSDAPYEETIEIDLAQLEPVVTCPMEPKETLPANALSHVKVDQVVIGSCTNGRLEDLEAAYLMLKGKKVAPNVHCIIIPGTTQIYNAAFANGWMTGFIDAGAKVSTPNCGLCLGGHMEILSTGERCIATTNHNFVTHMGHEAKEVYLASPMTAAASAINGYITDPREILG